MPKKSSIAIFIAATSALAISTVDSNSVKSGPSPLLNKLLFIIALLIYF